jgi:transforming growth factor-beta-induced protein
MLKATLCTAIVTAGLGLFAAPAIAGGCGGSSKPMTAMKASNVAKADIVDTAASAKQFNTLLAAAKAAGLVEALKGDGPITVFAPTDDAFAKLPEGTVESLLKPENKAALAGILTYHVVPGKVTAAKVVKASALDTLNGQRLAVKVDENGVAIDNAKVVKTDITASNGVIHVIDSVMLPTDKTIVDIAAGGDQFSTLVAAVKAAGLVDALNGKGPLTVFAPTNEAFAKLPEGTVENLLKPENKDQLIAVLTYHVVPGRVFSETAAGGATVETLQGATVTTKSTKGKVMVNNATVIAADVDASNGVIHVIDTVILPPTGEQAAARMIEQTIAKGVPVFNAGHTSQCAKMYHRTLMTLASHDAINPQMQRVIKRQVSEARKVHHSGQRAWMYRHTLDMVYASLSDEATMEMASTR